MLMLLLAILACTSSVSWAQAPPPPERNATQPTSSENVTLVWQEGEGTDEEAGNEYRCEVDVCLNGGSCYQKRGLRTCVCSRGYYGRRCQFFNNNVVIDPCPYINSTPSMRAINRGRWAKLSCRYEQVEAVLKCIDGEWVGDKPVCSNPEREQSTDAESNLERRIEDLERTVNGMMAQTFHLIKRMAIRLERLPVFNTNISFPCFGRRCPWDFDDSDEDSLEEDDDGHGSFFDIFGDDDEDEEDYYREDDDDSESDDDDGVFGSTWRRQLGLGRMFRRFGSMAKNFAQQRGLLHHHQAKDRRRPCANGDCPFLDAATEERPCLNGNCPWADRDEDSAAPRKWGMGRGRRMGHHHGRGRRGHMMQGKEYRGMPPTRQMQ